jgi:NAD(P)-dependent dehydrogenase (short-subunit alcohol dehydrogenase family)
VLYASEAEKGHLNRHCEIEEGCLLSTDISDLQDRLRASGIPKGVDVVISSSETTDLRTLWSGLAPNGRLILTGANNSKQDTQFLDPAVFCRGASVSCFNLSDMLENSPEEVASLLQACRKFVDTAFLSSFPSPEQFEIGELESAVQSVMQTDAYSRAVLSCGPDSIVRVQRAPSRPLQLRKDASYLLVGCLGGLGRSLTMWMKERGARHFIFLSRSADDKPEAALLIKELRESSNEVTVTVVRGDVTERKDVDRAVKAARYRLRGVIQAAAMFKDDLFSSMTVNTFNEVLRPKVQGTINLHEATLNLQQPLDFFVMTSSTIGVVGASTQSHYAAANAFLDEMAHHRRSQGLQATSLSLGMVTGIGHVEEKPEIEQALRKKGSYGISEAEYLRMMELACRSRHNSTTESNTRYGSFSDYLIVTGLDPIKIIAPQVHTQSAPPEWMRNDPRLRHLAHIISSISAPNSQRNNPDNSTATDPTTNTILLALLTSSSSTSDPSSDPSLKAEVQSMTLHTLSSLLHIPYDKLTASLGRPLSELGMDSITGAEFRGWAWRELRAELDFMTVLEGGRRVEWLVQEVWRGVGWEKLGGR